MFFHAVSRDAHHFCHFLVGVVVHAALLYHELGLVGHGAYHLVDFVYSVVHVVEVSVVFFAECRFAIFFVSFHAFLLAQVVHAFVAHAHVEEAGESVFV